MNTIIYKTYFAHIFFFNFLGLLKTSEDRLNLRIGRANEIADFPDLSDRSDIDIKRLNNGRRYFQDNIAMCVFAMLCFLVVGLSVVNLLDPLVFTNKSNTSQEVVKTLSGHCASRDTLAL